MARKGRGKVVVDTYALIAIAYGEVGDGAEDALLKIKRDEVKGLIPSTVVYEYIVHWMRGRVPALRSLNEVITYLTTFFTVVELNLKDWIKAAEIKVSGDKMLKGVDELRRRTLSMVDSTIIVVGLREKVPIVSGDRDLRYVAEALGVRTI